MSEEQNEHQPQAQEEGRAEMIVQKPAPEGADHPSLDGKQQHYREEVAEQLGEDASRLVTRTDITELLGRMEEGVTVTIHISRPRFWSHLTTDDLGLTAGKELATSAAANKALNDYFELGRRSLLPKSYQDKLANAESSARYCLARYSFKSHWGAFIPRTAYKEWNEDNARLEAAFWAARDEILLNYEQITQEVVEAAHPLAEDAWKRVMLGTALFQQEDRLTREILEEVITRLRAGQGKEDFVENYLTCIRAAMPKKEDIEHAFTYEVERGVIPLPSLLAADMENADRIYRARTLRDAKVRAELEAIEVARRLELQKLSQQQRQEQEEQYRKLQLERESQQRQLDMERDVLNDARRQKERLVREFYRGVVIHINTLIDTISQNILGSLEDHGGVLRGPVSGQLRNLITQLEQLNFVNDEQVASQIARLQAVLPSEGESEKAAKGTAKINTERITAVVRALHDEAEKVLVDLGSAPKQRRTRRQDVVAASGEGLLDLGTPRKARPGAVLSSQQDEGKPRRRRARNSTVQSL